MRTRCARLFSFSCLRRHDLLIGNLKKVESDGTAGGVWGGMPCRPPLCFWGEWGFDVAHLVELSHRQFSTRFVTRSGPLPLPQRLVARLRTHPYVSAHSPSRSSRQGCALDIPMCARREERLVRKWKSTASRQSSVVIRNTCGSIGGYDPQSYLLFKYFPLSSSAFFRPSSVNVVSFDFFDPNTYPFSFS